MRTLILSIITFIITIITYSQAPSTVFYIEEFNSNSPLNWETFNDATSSGTHDWDFNVTDMPAGANFTNSAAIFDDFAAGDTGLHDRRHLMRSASIDLSAYQNVKIGYEYAIQENAGAGKLVVLLGYPAHMYTFQTYTNSTDPTYIEYDIEAFLSTYSIPRDDFYIDFIYDDEDSGQNWGAGIGVVKLIGDALPVDNSDCATATDVTASLENDGQFDERLNIANSINSVIDFSCDDNPIDMGGGAWYKFSPTTVGNLTLEVIPYEWDSEVIIVSGACGDYTCVGHSDNPTDNGIENIEVALEAGIDYYICVGTWSTIIENYAGITDITLNWLNTTDVSESNIEGFKMYPNPAHNQLNLSADEIIKSVNIFNMLGQEVIKSNQNTIDIHLLPSGTYSIKIQTTNQTGTYKFIKSK